MKKYFIGVYNKSVILTYIGICISIFGMFNVKNLDISMTCLILAGICDLFDGKIARMCKRTEQEKKFGIEIDSLADVVSFLVFPSVILMSMENNIWSCLISMFYILAGVTRLGWFNITTEGKTEYYQGLPVTFSALILPVFYLLNTYLKITFPIFSLLYLLIGVFFILNLKIKKPTGVWYGIFGILAILLIILLLL